MPDGGFDAVVAAMDAAMVIVTTAVDGEQDGCLVGFHAQCSIEPRRYGVWLSVANRTCELARRASHLALHLVPSDAHPLAATFGGQTADEVDKLADCAWEPGPGGAPLLRDADVRFVGRVTDHLVVAGADHELFVLEPVQADAPASGFAPLRLGAVSDISPGHEATERR